MLTSVTLDGIRSFDDAPALRFAPLTLLAGANNSGKSTVIQALLCFLQSEQTKSQHVLALNGAWCDLGNFDRVVSSRRPRSSWQLAVGLSGVNSARQTVDAVWTLGPTEEPESSTASILELDYSITEMGPGDPILPVAGVVSRSDGPARYRRARGEPEGDVFFAHPGSIQGSQGRSLDILPFNAATTHHVGPFRLPPQPLYAPRAASQLGPRLGRYGEHTAEVIQRQRSQSVELPLPRPGTEGGPPTLLDATNAWWSHVFDGKYSLQPDAPGRLGYTLAIDTPSAEGLGLGQVGLGLSQALPIVVACLTSKPGDLLLIETPEAHLHPGAQHRLASLFVQLARSGRQVVVETHSEHIVNAARLAVKAGDLKPAEVAIQFFSQDDGRTFVREVDLDPNGRALSWPPGFFDQASADLAELLR